MLDALAVARITRLITEDVIFDRPRQHVVSSLHAAGYDLAIEGLGCSWCVGVWVALGATAARMLAPRTWDRTARLLAVAQVGGYLASRN